MTAIKESKDSLISIQLCRAIAAISVVYCHYALYAFPKIAAGSFGVDIFFIISGFVIAFVVSKTTESFFLKRILRIVPLYIIATTLTIVAALAFPQYFYNTTITVTSIIKSLLFIPYKIGKSGPILLAGWTLNLEMCFYLVMGACILLIKDKRFITLTCTCILVLFMAVLNWTNSDSYALDFYRTGLLPEFIGGLLLHRLYSFYNGSKACINFEKILKKDFRKYIVNSFLLIIAALCLLILFFSELPDFQAIQFSENRNIQFGIPSFIFVGSMLAVEKNINREGRFIKLGLLMGDSSYAMYLFHPYFIYFLQRIAFPKLFGSDSILLELMKFIVVLIVTTGGSILVFKLVDRPIQQYFKRTILLKS